MKTKVFEMDFAGQRLRYSFVTPGTRGLFRPWPRPADGSTWDVAATPELIEQVRNFFPAGTSDAYLEYRCLIGLTAQRLLAWRCCLFHAVAFRWRDRAWLLTAPPGTGKTTQFLNWQQLFPDEIEMISGDMPALEARKDGTVWVHPSAWNGKENLKGADAAPLGGVVLLEQGRKDQIVLLSPREAVLPLLQQFMVVPETEEEIRSLTGLLEQMLTAAPCWRMVNRGGAESTTLLRRTLLEAAEKGAGDRNGTV